MKKYIVIFIVLSNVSLVAFGNAADLFLNKMKKIKPDSLKVESIREFGIDVESEDFSKAKLIYEYAIETSQEINNYSCESKSYLSMAILYLTYEIYDTARIHYNSALKYGIKAKNSFDIGKSYIGIGNIFYYNDQHDSAVFYYLNAVKNLEKANNYAAVSKVYGNISSVFNQQGNNKKSKYYGKLAVDFAEKSKDDASLAFAYNNYGVALRKADDVKGAMFYMNKSLQYFKKIGKVKNIVDLYQNISDNHLANNDLLLAKVFADSCVYYAKITEDNYDITFAYIHRSIVALQMKEIPLAEQYLNNALPYLEQDSSWILLREWNLQAFEINKLKGNYKAALQYQEQYYIYIDSIRNEDIAYNVNLLETKFETQRKENEILKQEQQLIKRKNWIVFLVVSVIILSLLSFLLYRFLKQRNDLLEKEKTIQQQKIIDLEKAKQLQATESILKGQEDERSRIAKDLHDGLGGLLSGVKYSLNNMKENVILSSENALSFERTVDMLDSGIQELRRVAHNMMPENLLKFGLDTAMKDYCTSISNTGKLNISYSSFGMENFNAETNISVTVYRVIQELINNTMKHAEATQSIVQITKENNLLLITVEDNGKGFDVENINKFKGAGWTNIQNRITYLKGKMNIDSSAQNGTSITIEIPLV